MRLKFPCKMRPKLNILNENMPTAITTNSIAPIPEIRFDMITDINKIAMVNTISKMYVWERGKLS